ncbi:MAG: DNA cytosine methyltransferase [Thermodesulfobacteriota bacterium]
MDSKRFSFYEFFAGGGMVRAGLGDMWQCLLANDFDQKKSATYKINWGEEGLKTADVRTLGVDDLPEQADLAWASFPCQDLSLAGGGAGLKGERSGTFWPFWELIKNLNNKDRAPSIVVLENVCGALTSHGGRDFAAICTALSCEEYRFGPMVIDAALFVPHSRPRLFIVAVRKGLEIPDELLSDKPISIWHTKALRNAYKKLGAGVKGDWLKLPKPIQRSMGLIDIIEEEPDSVVWHSPKETDKLLAMMSDVNAAKVEAAKKMGGKIVGAIYKRTRRDESGRKVQRAEIRFDDIAGCLRTPAGGSSRQFIMMIEGDRVRSRLISSRETARLMGLPEEYVLPKKYNEAYHLTGDGVAVPVVRYLAQHLFEPILNQQEQISSKVAA